MALDEGSERASAVELSPGLLLLYACGESMMEAGREMDALVAEKVMGLVLLVLAEAPCPYCGDEMRWCGERSRCTTCGEWRYGPAKEYSDDIATAWEVVEKVGGATLMTPGAFTDEGLGPMDDYYCLFAAVGGSGASDVSLPHAICLAALAAVGALPKEESKCT